jgi:hypothetical protein
MELFQKLDHELAIIKLRYEHTDRCAREQEKQIFDLFTQLENYRKRINKLEKDLEDALVHNDNLIEKYSKALYLGTHMHLLKDKNGAEYKSNYKELLAMKYPELSQDEPETIAESKEVSFKKAIQAIQEMPIKDLEKMVDEAEGESETITKAKIVEIVNDMAGDYPDKFNTVKCFEDIDAETLKIATEDGCFGHYTIVD